MARRDGYLVMEESLNDYLTHLGGGRWGNDHNIVLEKGKEILRRNITSGGAGITMDADGKITIEKRSGPSGNGELYGGIPTTMVTTLVPASLDREQTLRMLQDATGLKEEEAKKFLQELEQQRQKTREYEKQFPIERLTIGKPFEELPGPGPTISPRTLELFREMAPFTSTPASPTTPSAQNHSAQPHIVLKSGDTVGGLYNSIPKDQRPPFEQFKQEFMQANPTVTDPNKLLAGKDYALPEKYHYDELKTAGRLIDPKVAALALGAVSGNTAQRTEGAAGHGVTAEARQANHTQR